MRSSAGVGITPPNVLGTPYPESSVMINSTLGAPLGGSMRAGQKGLEPWVVRSMVPPNFCGGGGICVPSMVVVALGEPGVPVICWAWAGNASSNANAQPPSRLGGAACCINFMTYLPIQATIGGASPASGLLVLASQEAARASGGRRPAMLHRTVRQCVIVRYCPLGQARDLDLCQ